MFKAFDMHQYELYISALCRIIVQVICLFEYMYSNSFTSIFPVDVYNPPNPLKIKVYRARRVVNRCVLQYLMKSFYLPRATNYLQECKGVITQLATIILRHTRKSGRETFLAAQFIIPLQCSYIIIITYTCSIIYTFLPS